MFDQFSEASNYDICIDWTNDSLFDIDFDALEIKRLLSNVNSNKACGPDGIHGKILKRCAAGLAHPLLMIFRLSYNSAVVCQETGRLPMLYLFIRKAVRIMLKIIDQYP